MQTASIIEDDMRVSIELPHEKEEVIPGVKWGLVYGFSTPAYWKYHVLARRLQNNEIKYKLGKSLKEEVAACLLGGHGIPASMGIAAFNHLKAHNAFGDVVPDEDSLFKWLKEPIEHNGKLSHYRFAKQKSKYLAAALKKLETEPVDDTSDIELRNWLIEIPGIGYKTASWVVRNWLDSNSVAILDIHLLRAGKLGGFLDPKLKIESRYIELEKQFIDLCDGLDVRASELDAVIWYEMMSAPGLVKLAMDNYDKAQNIKSPRSPRTKQSNTNSKQFSLRI